AVRYFLPLIEPVAQDVANHPCRSKNKADVSDFEPLMNDLFLGVHEKMHLMRSIEKTETPSSESLLQARNTFVAPMSALNPIMEKPAKKSKTSKTNGTGHNSRWSVQDDWLLFALARQGAPITEMMRQLSRTQSAIKSRLKKLRLKP
ncbi:MAG: hypothetical protein IJT12_02135, partial [Paludibacteraceae bacterium]|nr:hypothetical protein [Paludibacteraceae bacterium]